MKYYTSLFGFFLIGLCSNFTNVENSENNDNLKCNSIEQIHVAYDNQNGTLLIKWDERSTDLSYAVTINEMTYVVDQRSIAVPINAQFADNGISIRIQKSCDSVEPFHFNGFLKMTCEGGVIQSNRISAKKPKDDKGGCCIIATSGNINVHNPCSEYENKFGF